MIEAKDIVNIAKYFRIVSHTKGRIRLRVNPKIKSEAKGISLTDIEDLPNKINGINSIKINKIIASITITYDALVFAPKLWEDLIKGENLEELTSMINDLAKEVV